MRDAILAEAKIESSFDSEGVDDAAMVGSVIVGAPFYCRRQIGGGVSPTGAAVGLQQLKR